jgi:uncharacterized protein (TIGR02677 family)
VDQLLDTAARREAEDAAPGAVIGASGRVGPDDLDDPRQGEFERGGALWRERWAGFRGWFLSEAHHPSQAKLLRAQARAAIPALLQVVATLNERRAGRSDRSADFRTLARWFAQAPTDADLHRLWRAAFGLYPSRHLIADEETLDHPVPASTMWADGPALQISPRLRQTGSYERRGKPNRVVDRSEQRRCLAELAAREATETAAARRALATARPTRLSDLGELDPAVFRLFLSLLGDALAARSPGARSVETTTSDGSLAIRLSALDDGRQAEIRTPEGTFRGPDHLIEILDLTAEHPVERTA